MYITNQILNKNRDPECVGITPDRKYWHSGDVFIKRSLRRSEWQLSPIKGTVHVPRQGHERILNEAAAMRYVAQNTTVPVPKLHCCFEDDGAAYLVMEYIQGVRMDQLDEVERAAVEKELDLHLAVLHDLRSQHIGGPSGLVVPPYRVTRRSAREEWSRKSSTTNDFIFCHNDLGQQNILVDPKSLKILAIIDWEYAGFYPEYFESLFSKRQGASIALEGEEDDTDRLITFLMKEDTGEQREHPQA